MVREHSHSIGCEFRRPVRVTARSDGEIFVATMDGLLGRVSLQSNPGKLEQMGYQPEGGLSRFMDFLSDEDWIEARLRGSNQIQITYGNFATLLEFDDPVISFSHWQPSKTFSVLCGESRQQIISFRLRTRGHSLFADMVEKREFLGLGLSEIATDSDASFVGISSKTGELWSLVTGVSDSKVLISPGRAEDGGIRAARGLASNGRGTWAFVDRDNYRLVFKRTSGEISFFGSKGRGDHEFDWPNDLCFLGPSTILVADTNNDRVASLNIDTGEFATVLSRNLCPDSLCRPVSLDWSSRGVTVVDRGNNRILEFGPSGSSQAWELSLKSGEKVNAAITLSVDGQDRRFLLGRSLEAGFIREVSAEGMETVNEFDGGLFDPQGMCKFGENLIVVSDTLNRRGIFLDDQLAVLRVIDLAAISGMPRFLCRTPSVVRGTVLFIDYATGLAVTSGIAGNGGDILRFDLNKIGFSSLRKIVEWGDKFVLFGRGKGGLAFLDEHFRLIVPSDRVGKLLTKLRAPVDGVAFSYESMIIIDKERDSILEISTKLLGGGSLGEKVVVS